MDTTKKALTAESSPEGDMAEVESRLTKVQSLTTTLPAGEGQLRHAINLRELIGPETSMSGQLAIEGELAKSEQRFTALKKGGYNKFK